jgi:UDP-2,3-diacylglucosamine hydrolase
LSNRKIYFISDVHLGLYPAEKSFEREKMLVKWLDSIKSDAGELYLMGDIFDFWHEYRKVVPRGFTRFLGKIAELSDCGTEIYFFTGNHDVWVYNYLPKEIGLTVYRKPVVKELNGLKFFLAHGDALGRSDISYKILKKIFTNKILQWLFARMHPNLAVAIGHRWSRTSCYAKGIIAEPFKGVNKEIQIVFAREMLEKEHFDFFIVGHRHIPYDIKLNESSRIINLGDWINNFSYAVLNGQKLELKSLFKDNEKNIIRS